MLKTILTKNYLIENYINNQLSTQDIADIVGCSKDSIRKYLLKFGILLRNNSEAQLLYSKNKIKTKSRKYPKLDNYDFLYNEYITNKLGINIISNKVGCNSNTVKQALKRHNVVIRTPINGRIINNDDIIINDEIITAGLLGDASLIKKPNGYTRFKKKNKFKEHVILTAKEFYLNKYNNYIKNEYVKQYNYNYYVFQTRVSPRLDKYYNLWYPYSTKKETIPDNIPITPNVLLNWFLDDGSSSYRIRKNEKYLQKTIPIIVYLCTDCFSKKSQLILTDRIYNEYKLKISVTPVKNNQWRMRIPSSQTNLFFEIIGKCPVPELQYKWKYPYTIGDKNAKPRCV